MDSYTLIAKLRKARRKHTISAGAQALFYELMAINNEEEWSEVFKCSATELCAALAVSEKTINVYRIELIRAGLVGYESGKTKRCSSVYCLFGGRLGDMNGSNIYYLNEHQTEYPMVVKTPDYIKHKRKTESKTSFEVEEVSARERYQQAAIKEFLGERDLNSNASFPEKTFIPEKEKNCAQKEKRKLPELADALQKIAETQNWGNVLEMKLLSAEVKVNWRDMDIVQREPYLQERRDLFEEFYAFNQDAWLVQGLPTWPNMAKHFYHWVEIQKNKALINSLRGFQNGNKSTGKNGNAQHSASADRAARNKGVSDLAAKSEEFLSQFVDNLRA